MIDWIEEHLLTCPSKYLFHFDCPGCGLQRSFVALLRGDVLESLELYPATIPILVLFVYTLLHLLFRFKSGTTVVKWMFIFCTAVIFVFYIYKIITLKIF